MHLVLVHFNDIELFFVVSREELCARSEYARTVLTTRNTRAPIAERWRAVVRALCDVDDDDDAAHYVSIATHFGDVDGAAREQLTWFCATCLFARTSRLFSSTFCTQRDDAIEPPHLTELHKSTWNYVNRTLSRMPFHVIRQMRLMIEFLCYDIAHLKETLICAKRTRVSVHTLYLFGVEAVLYDKNYLGGSLDDGGDDDDENASPYEGNPLLWQARHRFTGDKFSPRKTSPLIRVFSTELYRLNARDNFTVVAFEPHVTFDTDARVLAVDSYDEFCSQFGRENVIDEHFWAALPNKWRACVCVAGGALSDVLARHLRTTATTDVCLYINPYSRSAVRARSPNVESRYFHETLDSYDDDVYREALEFYHICDEIVDFVLSYVCSKVHPECAMLSTNGYVCTVRSSTDDARWKAVQIIPVFRADDNIDADDQQWKRALLHSFGEDYAQLLWDGRALYASSKALAVYCTRYCHLDTLLTRRRITNLNRVATLAQHGFGLYTVGVADYRVACEQLVKLTHFLRHTTLVRAERVANIGDLLRSSLKERLVDQHAADRATRNDYDTLTLAQCAELLHAVTPDHWNVSGLRANALHSLFALRFLHEPLLRARRVQCRMMHWDRSYNRACLVVLADKHAMCAEDVEALTSICEVFETRFSAGAPSNVVVLIDDHLLLQEIHFGLNYEVCIWNAFFKFVQYGESLYEVQQSNSNEVRVFFPVLELVGAERMELLDRERNEEEQPCAAARACANGVVDDDPSRKRSFEDMD